jgi:glycerol-3-phosphate dehydrogenase
MARTVEDVLARRTRALFLNAGAAIALAPRVAEIMAKEFGEDAGWVDGQVTSFNAVAEHYLVR